MPPLTDLESRSRVALCAALALLAACAAASGAETVLDSGLPDGGLLAILALIETSGLPE
jgi:hypothetical protein